MEESILDRVLAGDFDVDEFWETVTDKAHQGENEWIEVETEDGKTTLVKTK